MEEEEGEGINTEHQVQGKPQKRRPSRNSIPHGEPRRRCGLYAIAEADPNPEGPKFLADVLEAVLGAVLIDSGGDLSHVWRAYQGIIKRAESNTFS